MDFVIRRVGVPALSPAGYELLGDILARAALAAVERGELVIVERDGVRTVCTRDEVRNCEGVRKLTSG